MQYHLTDQTTIEQLTARAGMTPSRSAGQNFLVCDEPVQAVVAGLEGGPQRVTELGAGVGPLTQAVIAEGYKVRAIEQSHQLAQLLTRVAVDKKSRERLELVEADLMRTPWEWDEPYQLIGNIPYNISGRILRRLTQLTAPPERVVLMVQREVGERLTASAPNLSLLGVAVQLWGEAHHLLTVPASCFWPAPAVDSQLVLLVPHDDMLPHAQREAVLNVAKVFFQQKRKQIGGVLRRQWSLNETDATALLTTLKLAPGQRPQELVPDHWIQLHQHLAEYRKQD